MQERQKMAGVRRLLYACRNSCSGLAGAFKSERAFRQEVALAVVLIPLGIYLGRSGLERAMLVASVLLLLLVELINTAIEAVVDRIGPERHELSGLAKDVGSSAVLLSLTILCGVWGFILFG
jgi:diacylglycerol kinase (ATP)